MNKILSVSLIAVCSIVYNVYFYKLSIYVHYLFSPPLPPPSLPPERFCPYNFNKVEGINDRCFHYLDEKKNFEEAIEYCNERLAFFRPKAISTEIRELRPVMNYEVVAIYPAKNS